MNHIQIEKLNNKKINGNWLNMCAPCDYAIQIDFLMVLSGLVDEVAT